MRVGDKRVPVQDGTPEQKVAAKEQLNRAMRMNIKVGEKPWLVKTAIAWLEGWVQPGMRVFEWGAGGSTVWFAKKGCRVYTAEAKYEWFVAVNEALRDISPRPLIVQTDISEDFKTYASAVRWLSGPPYDLIVIDGENGSRLACATNCLAHLRGPDSVLLLDNSGSAEHIDATNFLIPYFGQRLVFVGEVEQEGPVDITETSIFIQPKEEMIWTG
jgi:hypothetical protein